MTPLAQILRETITRTGPISIAEFMAEALSHPEHGYYRTRDPFGRSGDFITAPEISQMFGELIGLWCVECWIRLGEPAPVALVELGPGRGTLMADALRAARVRPSFLEAVEVHLVETSPRLRARQKDALALCHPTWHERVEELPQRPTLLIANEFFDALPIRQFERTATGWRERLVANDPQSAAFITVTADLPPDPSLPLPDPARAPPGAVVELAPLAERITTSIAGRIAASPGAALIIDYGYAIEDEGRSAWNDTLQAVRGHGYVSPLADPGEADITAHVDFAALARAARGAGAAVHGPVSQGRFLETLGIGQRAMRLASSASPSAAADVTLALHRLTAPSAMGRLFQVLAISHPAMGTPSGFA
ncbi:MAG: class I SAM-dependent methyltransferase [Alphaproteobacteria bacterium]